MVVCSAVRTKPEPGAADAVSVRLIRDGCTDGPLLLVAGEADIGTAPRLRAELASWFTGGTGIWTVDLSALRFCDLKGLDALRDAEHAARRTGSRVRWREMSAQLHWLAATFPAAIPAAGALPSADEIEHLML